MKIKDEQKIGLDIDEVVANFMKHFLDYSNNKNKTSFTLEDINNYYLWKTKIHSSKEESISEIMAFQQSEHFEKIDLIDGVKEVLEVLYEKHTLYFITSRPQEFKEDTKRFFAKYFPNQNFEIIHSEDMQGGKTKSEICEELGIEIMVEDNADYALNCAEKGIKVFLIDKPWNKKHSEHENIIKIKELNEFLKHLKE